MLAEIRGWVRGAGNLLFLVIGQQIPHAVLKCLRDRLLFVAA